MSKDKRIKNIDHQKANAEIQKAQDNKENAILLKDALKSFPGMDTVDQIREHLNSKTGFENVLMSADALNLKSQYVIVSRFLQGVDFSVYDEDFNVSQEYKNKCLENATTYWNDADLKLFTKIEKALKQLNNFGLPINCFYNDNQGQILFNEKAFDLNRQLSNFRPLPATKEVMTANG